MRTFLPPNGVIYCCKNRYSYVSVFNLNFFVISYNIAVFANCTFCSCFSVAPTITTVGNQHIREAVGRNTSIKCIVEAFPEAVRYWKKDNTQLIESDNKYSISIRDDFNTKYKVCLPCLHFNEKLLLEYYVGQKNMSHQIE